MTAKILLKCGKEIFKLQDARIRPADEEGQEIRQRNRKGFGGLVGGSLTGWPLQSGLPISVAEVGDLSFLLGVRTCVRAVQKVQGCSPCNLESQPLSRA